jgi:hypothetical protein
MSPLNKSDAKDHLSIHDRNGRRLQAVQTVADATGFSSEESGIAEAVQGTGESLKQSESPDRAAALRPVLVDANSKREQA